MRTYASPGLCFDCRQELRGEAHCPRCGLPVVGAEADQLARLLFEADRLMASLDAMRRREPVPTVSGSPRLPPGPPFGSNDPPTQYPRYPGTPPASTPRRSVSAGSVFLALGAGCLVVAALVFVAVTWGSLSLGTRTLVLLAVTALAFAVTVLLTSRRLHGSVEALSTVTWMFLAIDVAAGRASGLFGLDRLSDEGFVVAAGLIAALPASVVVAWTRRQVGREPVVSSLVAFGGWNLAMLGIAGAWTASTGWLLVLLVAAAAALAVGYALLELSWLAWGLTALAAALHAALFLTVVVACLRNDYRELLVESRIWPVLACLALTVLAVEGLRRRDRTRAYADTIVVVGAVLVTTLVALLVAAPAWHAGPGWGTAALCLVTLVCTAVGRSARLSWASGPRFVCLAAGLLCAGVALPWVAAAALAIGETMTQPWRRTVGAGIDVFDVGDDLPLWTAVACLLTLAVAAALVSTWERPWLTRPVAGAVAAALVWVTASLLLVVLSSLLLVAVLVVAVPGLLLVAAGVRGRIEPLVLGGAAALAVACGLAVASVGLSLAVWAAGLAVCVALVLRRPRARTSVGVALCGVLLVVGCTAAVVELAGGAARAQSLVLSIALALVLVATLALPTLWVRAGIMLGAWCAASLPVLLAVDLGPGRTSLSLTVIGAAAALVGVLDRTRWPVGAAGATLLLAAWWLRLIASDIEVVEAYTGLPAAILLAAGLWAVLRNGRSTMEALLPGLVLALAPSLPWAMLDPTSTRGLVLSAAGLALLAAGSVPRWAAPFLAGAGVVALMTLAQLAPFAQAAPRWAVLSAVGLILLGVGITWEARVRDLRSSVVFVTAMR